MHIVFPSSFAGKETLRCLALALKRMPMGQQSLSFDDENDLTFIGLVCSLFLMSVLLLHVKSITTSLICLLIFCVIYGVLPLKTKYLVSE